MRWEPPLTDWGRRKWLTGERCCWACMHAGANHGRQLQIITTVIGAPATEMGSPAPDVAVVRIDQCTLLPLPARRPTQAVVAMSPPTLCCPTIHTKLAHGIDHSELCFTRYGSSALTSSHDSGRLYLLLYIPFSCPSSSSSIFYSSPPDMNDDPSQLPCVIMHSWLCLRPAPIQDLTPSISFCYSIALHALCSFFKCQISSTVVNDIITGRPHQKHCIYYCYCVAYLYRRNLNFACMRMAWRTTLH